MAVLFPGKFIYLATPHTASIATTRALARLEGAVVSDIAEIQDLSPALRFPKGTHHATRVELRTRQPESFVGIELAVTTVRNPYDLLVTWWLRQRGTLGEQMGREISFRAFVEEYDEGMIGSYVRQGKIFWQGAEDFLRYERLQDDLDHLLERFGLPPVELEWVNVTSSKLPWPSYYDHGVLDVVQRRFGDEIDAFGYRFLSEGGERHPASP